MVPPTPKSDGYACISMARACGGHSTPLRQLCFNLGILPAMLLLSVLAVTQTRANTGGPQAQARCDRKREVSPDNASGALGSHLGWEKLPWDVCRNPYQSGNLFVTIVNQLFLFPYQLLKLITVKEPFGLAWRGGGVCVSRRYLRLAHFMCSFRLFFF